MDNRMTDEKLEVLLEGARVRADYWQEQYEHASAENERLKASLSDISDLMFPKSDQDYES